MLSVARVADALLDAKDDDLEAVAVDPGDDALDHFAGGVLLEEHGRESNLDLARLAGRDPLAGLPLCDRRHREGRLK